MAPAAHLQNYMANSPTAERSLQVAGRVLDSVKNEKIKKTADASTRPHSLTNMELQGRIAAIRASMATSRGDIQSIVKFSEQALKCLHKGDTIWRAEVALSLGLAESFKGDEESAIKAISEAVAASKAAGNL